MDHPGQLTGFQIEFAHVFFDLDEAAGYFVAGGAALLASDLIARPTEDLDLFTAKPTVEVTRAKDAFVREVRERGCDVKTIQDSATFCRMIVARAGEETVVDLAVDSPPQVTDDHGSGPDSGADRTRRQETARPVRPCRGPRLRRRVRAALGWLVNVPQVGLGMG